MPQAKSNHANFLQSDEEKLSKIVDTFFEDHSLSTTIETIGLLKTNLFEKDGPAWSNESLSDLMHDCRQLETFLCKLYELRAPHLYQDAGQIADPVLS